jgi:ribosomal protein L28
MIPFHLTTSALRTIDKMGGLDEYLLHSKHVSTKGEGEGQRVRNRLIQKIKHREMLKQCAIDRGENVDDWDRIVLEGKKIRQQQAPLPTTQSLPSSSLMEES